MRNIYLSQKDVINWQKLRKQVVNGWHMEPMDKQELLRLNHLLLEATGDIHNENMLVWMK